MNDEPTELTRYVTKGDVLYPVGDIRITITLSAACIEAGKRATEQIARLKERMHGQAVRRLELPSDRKATIIDQE